MFSLLSPSWFHLRFPVLQFTIADNSRSQEYSHRTIRLHDQKNSLLVQPKSVNVLVSVSWHCFQWGIISANRGLYSLSSWRFFHAFKRPAAEPLIKRSTRSRERFWTVSLHKCSTSLSLSRPFSFFLLFRYWKDSSFLGHLESYMAYQRYRILSTNDVWALERNLGFHWFVKLCFETGLQNIRHPVNS